MEGDDVFATLPTGGGESIMLPTYIENGLYL
jgi:superfamily II DNA helicase RecQ